MGLLGALAWAAGCASRPPDPPGRFTIAGSVSGTDVAGVVVTLSGTKSDSQTTGASGAFRFADLPTGSYAIALSRAGFAFTPTSVAANLVDSDLGELVFDATAVTDPLHGISGTITGAGAAHVLVGLSGAATGSTTTTSGTYTLTGLPDGVYTVTPTLQGYAFEPASRQVTLSGADLASQDFTATPSTAPVPHSISGVVSGATAEGVLVTLSGPTIATTSKTTGSDGGYIFADVVDGSYTVTPSRVGYTFSPAHRDVTVNGADVTGQDFSDISSEMLDQSLGACQSPPITQCAPAFIITNGQSAAQSFTPGMSGRLSGVRVRMANPTPYTVRVRILSADSVDALSSTSYDVAAHTLATADSAMSTTMGWQRLSFVSPPVIDTASKYIILVSLVGAIDSSVHALWDMYNDYAVGSQVDSYTGGRAFSCGDGCASWILEPTYRDFAFETYVSP
jgi:hypothetical protein